MVCTEFCWNPEWLVQVCCACPLSPHGWSLMVFQEGFRGSGYLVQDIGDKRSDLSGLGKT